MNLESAKLDYRRKHKHCSYCEYLKYINKFYIGTGVAWYKCKVSDKMVKHKKLNSLLCKYYTVKTRD